MVDGTLRHQMESLCAGLTDLGLDAELSKTRETENGIGLGGFFKVHSSRGLIYVREGPIRWINLKEARESKGPRRGELPNYLPHGLRCAL